VALNWSLALCLAAAAAAEKAFLPLLPVLPARSNKSLPARVRAPGSGWAAGGCLVGRQVIEGPVAAGCCYGPRMVPCSTDKNCDVLCLSTLRSTYVVVRIKEEFGLLQQVAFCLALFANQHATAASNAK
jgi:hypothetical protein